eukprot:3388628-Rhodomonas_salina.2
MNHRLWICDTLRPSCPTRNSQKVSVRGRRKLQSRVRSWKRGREREEESVGEKEGEREERERVRWQMHW